MDHALELFVNVCHRLDMVMLSFVKNFGFASDFLRLQTGNFRKESG